MQPALNVDRKATLQKIPFVASTPQNMRRQTIGSPLTSANRL
jgi:hypothetical protein